MRFHVGDYLADTMHLSTFQHGIYVLLIMHYFKHGSLPDDEASLARIAKVGVFNWRRSSPPVVALFRVTKSGALRHSRIDAEREHARQVSEARQEAGKQGARRKWGMANAKDADSKCHSARGGARATEPELNPESPPVTPRKRGVRGRGLTNGGGKESRNASADMLAEELRHAETNDPPSGGAPVVPFPRRGLGCSACRATKRS